MDRPTARRVRFAEIRSGLKITYTNPQNGDEVDVGYQYTFGKVAKDGMRSPTTEQRPDIVVHIRKKGQGITLTYLFDAKYSVNGDDDPSIETVLDEPKPETINAMHHYRDAIYYGTRGEQRFSKEIIGGYILFPGDGKKADVQVSKFYKTIEEVNIGAFPLRPKDIENRELLVEFIKTLIGEVSGEILNDSKPQKGLYYTMDKPRDAEYMILALDQEVNKDMDAVVEGCADSIIMGRLGMEETKDIGAIRYIAPIIPGKHINGYYSVVKANLTNVDDEKYPIRIKFDVCDWVQLEHPVIHGTFPIVFRGLCKSRDEFFKFCEEHAEVSIEK